MNHFDLGGEPVLYYKYKKGGVESEKKIKKIMWKDLSARWMSLVSMGKKPIFMDLKILANCAK